MKIKKTKIEVWKRDNECLPYFLGGDGICTENLHHLLPMKLKPDETRAFEISIKMIERRRSK